MRPIDHFIARLDKLAASLEGGGGTGPKPPDKRIVDQAGREFTALIAPVIGIPPAESLAVRMREHIEKNAADSLRKMGYMAAFFLEEYDTASMPLEAEDWREIRETIEDASEEIDITVLTSLMDGLLSLGLLERR
jgi:hypothetical protein